MKIKNKLFFFFLSLFILTSCSRSHPISGYIEGEYSYIASGVSGTALNIYVTRGQEVKKGDTLYQLDPEPEKSMVEETRATLKELIVESELAKIQLERQQKLLVRNTTAKSTVDIAKAEHDSKLQKIVAAQAKIAQSEWALNQKTKYAPADAYVFETFFYDGEQIPANTPVVALLTAENINVLFYVPEKILSQIRLGQTISFGCDNCKGRTQAKIYYISPEAEYTPPVIYSQDTRNKLVFLVRAEMPPDVAKKFHPGQPIDVYLRP